MLRILANKKNAIKWLRKLALINAFEMCAMASKHPFTGDFTSDPAGVHLFDFSSENVFSQCSKTTQNNASKPLFLMKIFTWQMFLGMLKVLFMLSVVVLCGLQIRQMLAPEYAFKTKSRITNQSLENLSKDSNYCPGPGWVAYKDEECFKLVQKWATRNEAAAHCTKDALLSDKVVPYLASIKSTEEQTFLTKLLFTSSEPNVWIGARRKATGKGPTSYYQFVWENDSPVNYTDWILNVDLSVEKRCVEMHKTTSANEAPPMSKWRLASCQQANYFVCQKPQRWPLEKMERVFLASRAAFQKTISTLTSQINSLERTKSTLDWRLYQLEGKCTLLQLNQQPKVGTTFGANLGQLLPPGFIYVQLPSQTSPCQLWPQLKWLDVSELYSVVFAGSHNGNWTSIKLCIREGEVRPRNLLIKIWKRIE